MKTWVLLILLLLLLFGCAPANQAGSEGTMDGEDSISDALPPEMTGYVMDQEKDRILVVSPTNDSNSGGRAMWVSGVPNELWLGKQVEIWTEGPIQESYPEQAKLKKISVLEMSDVNGADMEATEALSSVLSEVETDYIYSVKMISFDEEADQWMVQLTEINPGNEEIKKIVEDNK